MDLGDIWAECGRLLNDPNNDRWSQSVITERANLAQTEIQGYTNAVRTGELIAIVAGTDTYTIDSSTMNVVLVYKTYVSGEVIPIQGITLEQLNFILPNWKNLNDGDPRYYLYSSTGQNITLVPAPDSNIASISVYESRKPADMDSSDDIPFDSNNQMIPYHTAIVHWVVAQCWMDDGTPEALAKSRFHKSGSMLQPGQYELQLQRINAEFDAPEDVPAQILWKPQGGRLGGWGVPSKSFPLTF